MKRRRKPALPVIWLMLKDEAPRIGSGSRRVRVISLGYKFVRLEAVASGCRAKLRRGVWDRLVAMRNNSTVMEGLS